MKEQKELKKFPKFNSDEDAQKFLDGEDLSSYDFSEFKPMSFEFAPKNKTLTLRLSENLLDAVKNNAAKKGIPYQKYIRHVLEDSIRA